MVKLKILPFSNESVEERVTAFRQYHDEVRVFYQQDPKRVV